MGLQEYEIYVHNEVGIKTVTEFLSDPFSPAESFKDDKVGFMNYSGGSGKSNLERIYEKYTTQEKEDNAKTTAIELLKINTELLVPKGQLNKEILSITGKNQFLKQSKFEAFYGEALLQLLSDPLYKSKLRYQYKKNNAFTSIFPHISIWIYVGALDNIVNVTPYVISCTSSTAKSGGSFSLSLPPVINLLDKDLHKFNESEFFSANNIQNLKKEFFFHQYLQANDIVFIKYEHLQIEKEQKYADFVLDKSVLAGQVYDMIGLIDSNSKTVEYQQNNATINIIGRDLMKLLIDDGSYFIPLSFVENEEDVFVNKQDDSKLLKRTFVSGAYDYLYTHSLKSISSTMQFIINQLANIGVVDEDTDLFSSYGERRTKVYRLEESSNLTETLPVGIWQIIKLLVDENVSDRRISDSSSSQPDNSLLIQIQKLCQEPFVEFFGDTYGDTYNFIARQPPFSKSQILSCLNNTISKENSIKGQKEGLSSFFERKVNETISEVVLTIAPDDILFEEINWEYNNIYSWYEIQPQGNFIGGKNGISLAHIPVVYFPQFANKWGSRKLTIVSNYISQKAFTGKDSDANRDFTKEAIINDYQYIIDSNIYLPFTRNATITINGDRRFKIGTWIRHGGTGEIYYVNQVSHNFSINTNTIDRTTTLVLSRGMVEKYLKGNITYFNLADTDFIREVLIERLTSGDNVKNKPKINIKSNFGINQEVFDFFYQRKQFENLSVSEKWEKYSKEESINKNWA